MRSSDSGVAEFPRKGFHRCRALLISALAFPVFAGSLALADDWTAYQHDAQHTGYAPVTFDPASAVSVWQSPAGYTAPLIVGSTVYALGGSPGSAKLTAFNAANGSQLWSDSIPGTSTSTGQSVAYSAGMLLYTSTGSLNVVNAANGSLEYSIPTGQNLPAAFAPVIYTDPNTGQTTAYVNNFEGGMSAYSIGSTSGSMLWTSTGYEATSSVPAIAGPLALVAGPGQFYAVNRSTGAVNNFHTSNESGGGGPTVVVDSTRQQFYVQADYSAGVSALTAYSYTSGGGITQLWQHTGVADTNGSALDSQGDIFSLASTTAIDEYSPAGNLIQTIAPPAGKQFAFGETPLIAGSDLLVSANNTSATFVYNLLTGQYLQSLPTGRGAENNFTDQSVAELTSNYLITDGDSSYNGTFNVYSVTPEPASVGIVGLGVSLLVARRRRVPCSRN